MKEQAPHNDVYIFMDLRGSFGRWKLKFEFPRGGSRMVLCCK